MSKLTIKSGCVEAIFKRGRERTKGTERNQPLKTEQPMPASKTVLRDAELDTPQQVNQSPGGICEHLVQPGEIEDFALGEKKNPDAGLPHSCSWPRAAGRAGKG